MRLPTESYCGRSGRNIAVKALFLFLTACCPATEKRMPPQFHFSDIYKLELSSVTVQKKGLADKTFAANAVRSEDCGQFYNDDLLSICASAESTRFRFQIANLGAEPLTLLWPDGRFLDENKESHAVDVSGAPYKRNAKATIRVLKTKEAVDESISPTYKTYPIREHCFSDVTWHEPLLPSTFEGRTREQMKAYVDDMRTKQTPIQVVLPVKSGKEDRVYLLLFLLKDRWVEEKASNLKKSIYNPLPAVDRGLQLACS